MSQRGRQLLLEKFSEFFLLWSDLDQDDVIVPRRDIAIDRLEMMFRRWAAGDEPGDGVRREMLAYRRKTFGIGQLGHHGPARHRPAKIPMSRRLCLLLPFGVAQRHLCIARPQAPLETNSWTRSLRASV